VPLLALVKFGGGLSTGSILLMLPDPRWSILFNVIARAIAIPAEFRECADGFRLAAGGAGAR
jgi:ABC-type anion transport system duplicated permease subunit